MIGILKIGEFHWKRDSLESDWYRVVSTCGCKECMMDMDIEWDMHSVSLNMEYDMSAADWYGFNGKNWFTKMWYRVAWRVRMALTCLFIGKVKTSAWFQFTGRDQVMEVIGLLHEAVSKYDEVKKDD